MLEIGPNIALQNIEHPAAIMDTTADEQLADVTLCGEDEFNLEESTSTHLSDNSDIGSNRNHNESSIVIISDTSDSTVNLSPHRDLSLESPTQYEDRSKTPDRNKRLSGVFKDITLTPSPKRIRLEDNVFNKIL